MPPAPVNLMICVMGQGGYQVIGGRAWHATSGIADMHCSTPVDKRGVFYYGYRKTYDWYKNLVVNAVGSLTNAGCLGPTQEALWRIYVL